VLLLSNAKHIREQNRQLEREYAFYGQVLAFCESPMRDNPTLTAKRSGGVDHAVVVVASANYIKLWRLAVAVCAQCQTGFAYEAGALIRSMFETMLFLEFVLRPHVTPKRDGKRIKHPQKPFDSKFRARMYIAHDALRRSKWAESAARTPGLRRRIPVASRRNLKRQALEATAAVGEFWAKELHKGGAGLSIRALSETLGVLKLYESLYRAHSASVHASDIEQFVRERDGRISLRLSPRVSTHGYLGESASLLLRGAYWMSKRLNLLETTECVRLLKQLDSTFSGADSRA